MAVASLDYLVALAPVPAYLAQLTQMNPPCADVAADLVALGHSLAFRFDLPRDRLPILLGFEQGGTLAFAALVQALPDQFHTVVSVDFCPQLTLGKPLCAEHGLDGASTGDGGNFMLKPPTSMVGEWFVFQSTPQPVCATASVADFIQQVSNAKLTVLPGPALDRNALSAQITALLNWLDPRIHRQTQPTEAITGIPLIEAPTSNAGPLLAVMLSGDGGWAKLDRSLAHELNKHGIPVVGWDTLSYFWDKKTPEQMGADLAKVLHYYLDAWHKQRILLIGYSFGADVLPFMASRLPEDLRSKVELIALLGLSDRTAFEFHLSDWLGNGNSDDAVPVPPEVSKLDWTKRLCIYGAKEHDSACPVLAAQAVTVLQVSGDHHFDGDYSGLSEQILKYLRI